MKDTKQHILEIALRLFLQKTFKEVTMQEIVQKTKLSKGAFYHYFESKEKLFAEVLNNFFPSLLKFELEGHENKSLSEFYRSCADKSGMIEKIIKKKNSSDATMNFYFLIFDAMKLLPGFREKLKKYQANELQIWERVIKNAKATGEIKSSLSNRNIATIFIYTGDGMALNLMLGGKPQNLKKDTLHVWNEFYKSLK